MIDMNHFKSTVFLAGHKYDYGVLIETNLKAKMEWTRLEILKYYTKVAIKGEDVLEKQKKL